MLSSKLSFPEKNIADRVPMLFLGGEEDLHAFAFGCKGIGLHQVVYLLQHGFAGFYPPSALALLLQRQVLWQAYRAVIWLT